MPITRLDPTLWLLVLLLTGAATGCTHVNKVPSYEVGPYPAREKHNLKVELRVPDELRRSEFQQSILGSRFKIVLGENLTRNSELVTKSVFSYVSVSDSLAEQRKEIVDATLTPRLIFVDETKGLWTVSQLTLTIALEWSLRDVGGNIVWIATMKGEGKSAEGGFLRSESSRLTDTRIKMALDDLFQKSFQAMSSSPEIKAFSVLKQK